MSMKDKPDDKAEYTEPKMPPTPGTHLNDPPAIEHARHPESEKKERSGWREFRDWATLVVTFLTLLAVALYAWVAYRQWGEMIRSNDETIRSNKLSQRAWLIVPSIGKKNIKPGKLDPNMRIKNVGHIPATEVSGTLAIGIVPVVQARLPHKLEGDVPAFSASLIAPGHEYTVFPMGAEPFDISSTVAKEIGAGKTTIIIFGRLRYTDPIKGDVRSKATFVQARQGA